MKYPTRQLDSRNRLCIGRWLPPGTRQVKLTKLNHGEILVTPIVKEQPNDNNNG